MVNIVIADLSVLNAECLRNFFEISDNHFHVNIIHHHENFKMELDHINPDFVIFNEKFYDDLGFDKECFQFHTIVISDDSVAGGGQKILKTKGHFFQNIPVKQIVKNIYDIAHGHHIEKNYSLSLPSMEQKDVNNFNLTRREYEVLSYLVRGQSNKEIARSIDLQVVTIKLHVRGICKKLGTSNRTQAVLIALQHGWKD